MKSTRLACQAAAALAAILAGAAAAPATAWAHASLIQREDLPLPTWLFVYGATLIVVVSFVGLLAGWRETKLEGVRSRPVNAAISRILLSRFVEIATGAAGVALLLLVIYAGLEGTKAPDRNFSVTFVSVTFGLGMVVVSALFGDVFRAFNPWRAAGRAVAWLLARIAGQRLPAPLEYPEWLGRWPAVVGLFAFLTLELIWGQTGFGLVGLQPRDVAIATIVYSMITFVAMALFGVETWIDRGETFSQYLGMFASLSPLQVRDGRIELRRPLSGATTWAGPAGSLALVLLSIAGTTFDGSQEGLLRDPIRSLFVSMLDGGVDPADALRLTNLIYLLICIVGVAAIFWGGILGMRIVERKLSALALSRLFAHAFIPIALAYLVAHYFSYFYLLQQAQFGFLLSDPLGTGDTDLFGTADNGIDFASINATLVQWVQFGAIVVGHVLALAMGHDRALKIWGNSRDAAWSQVWMLVMMMLFSVLGLYLLSLANE